jgi:hypothetical protein
MRRRRGQSAQAFISEDLVKQVNALMDNRRRLLAPFPVEARAIYNAGWTAEEHEAIKLLQARREGLLRMGRAIKLRFHSKEKQKDYSITIQCGEDLPMAQFAFELFLKDLPSELKVPIAHWIPEWWKLHVDQAKLVAKVKSCASVCKTYGQLHRMWPDVLSLMNDKGKEKIGAARVRSAYPEAAFKWHDTETGERVGELREDFTPEAFAPFTGMIAECLMLPEKEIVEVAKIELSRG